MTIQRLLAPARVGWLLVIWALSISSFARAESPYDTYQRKLAAQVERQGKKAEAVVDLLRMTRAADDVDPDVNAALFERLGKRASLDVQHRVYARRRVAWDRRRRGDVDGTQDGFDALGYVRAFRIIGPFDNEGKRGFEEPFAPEQQRVQAVNVDAAYQGRERLVRWRALPDVVAGGYVIFDATLRPTENVCGYAETVLSFDADRPITLWLGAGGASKLFFNGVEVLSDSVYRASPHPDRAVVAVSARKGENRVLVKECVQSGTWGFYLRVGDARGEPLAVKADPSLLGAIVAADPEKTKVSGPTSVLDQLERAAQGERQSAQALENLARFLWSTGADDPAEHRARQLAERAADAGPTAARYLFAAELAPERHEKLRFVAKAEALAPKDPAVILARAELTYRGPGAERALALLERIGDKGREGLDALALRVSVLRHLGLDDTAEGIARRVLAQAPRSTNAMSRLAELLDRKAKHDELLSVQSAVFSLRNDHVGARKALIDDALTAGRTDEVERHLEQLKALYPADERRLFYVAEVYDALGRDDLVLKTLTFAEALAPDSAEAHVRMGRALLREGQIEAASDSLRKALVLRPQDAETRELLEQLAPEPRRDEAYAIDKAQLLARKSSDDGRPLTILQDLTVNTVFENGLGSRFVQLAVQVHDQEGARRMRARSIQFDPESQRVDLRLSRVYRADGRVLEANETYEQQLGEPWYRIYYDTRALVVVFPDLEPGDVVELRYRVDDVSPRNLFADYFGDLHFFQGSDPRTHVEYVLMAPKKRELYFNEPKLAALKHEKKSVGDLRIDRFFADDVPAIAPEPSLPGTTEVAPYLHVSTYKTWDEVGHWYWGLIRDQLYADESLKKVVHDLTHGVADEREKVKRIYGWVVTNTRYVALEFGIHGYLPYRVPEIVRRGFGDCKDKASLIYTMLREAGIDARIVLTRTRRNGKINDLPASLAVFDHAIAYVPSLDLYLDGTAEHSGITELPGGDQGVTVLLVGEKSAELRRTPVLPASSNERKRTIHIELAPDGTGDVRVEERVQGVEAAAYRQTYAAEGTRKDRFERSLGGAYPGLSLSSLEMRGLTDIEQTVELAYRLRAPQVARREGNELRIAPSALHDLLRQMASIPKRTHTLELGVLDSFHEARTITVPSGYRVGKVPTGGKVETRFGRLSLRVDPRGREVKVETSFQIDVDQVAPTDYPAFRAFVEEADAILRQRVSFVVEKP